jgi:imidazolonepropionase-like amidohydrolase
MRARCGRLALALLLGTAPFPALQTAAETFAVRGDVVHTSGPSGTLQGGVVRIQSGRIEAVGPSSDVASPADVRLFEGAVVTPGLIDTHSVAGLNGLFNVPADQDADERSGANQAGLRAIDGFNPREPGLAWLLHHGVTAVQSGPGEANPIGGLAGVFRTHGTSVEDMTLRFPSALVLTLGERPKATYAEAKQAPLSRMGTAALIRQAFVDARNHAKKGKKKGGDDAPGRDLGTEALTLALRAEIPTLITARRRDDIDTALRIAREFSLDLHLADAVDGYLMARELWDAGIPVHVGPVMERLGPLETLNASFEAPAILAAAGVPITFQSGYEAYVPKIRVVLFEAAVAAAYGLGPERALRALTSDAAERLGVADRIGSLEAGKDADLVVWDGDPFEYTTHVLAVIVRGEVAYLRE